jgi:phytoene dehydrogenase-like protein
MHYDVVIIGAGMSGLAAGIRLAYYEKRVLILEKHYAFGGLNSYYKLHGREFDVGLHAVTNYVPEDTASRAGGVFGSKGEMAGMARRAHPDGVAELADARSHHLTGGRNAPLNKLLRQLRLTREDFDLRPQSYSVVQFPGCSLKFANGIGLLESQVAERFPKAIDDFCRLVEEVVAYDDAGLDVPYQPTRPYLRDRIRDPLLIEMLLCPIMFYGSAEEHDLDLTQFVTLFKSIYLEGFARPRQGVRQIIKALVRKFRECGGEIRMQRGVERLVIGGERVKEIVLQNGETVTADVVLSSAGVGETMALCGDARGRAAKAETGRLSFVETIAILDQPPRVFGHEATIVFYNHAETFTYARPGTLVDLRSGILCCPSNYSGHQDDPEGKVRLTWLANYDAWARLPRPEYDAKKQELLPRFMAEAERFLPDISRHVLCTDMFTPVTIHHFTGHAGGAVYGSPAKRRDGRTPVQNLFICGTDQGYLGIIGAMLSGISMANMHVLDR